jgi:hypothetical protein
MSEGNPFTEPLRVAFGAGALAALRILANRPDVRLGLLDGEEGEEFSAEIARECEEWIGPTEARIQEIFPENFLSSLPEGFPPLSGVRFPFPTHESERDDA